jgi:hypothetical protein
LYKLYPITIFEKDFKFVYSLYITNILQNNKKKNQNKKQKTKKKKKKKKQKKTPTTTTTTTTTTTKHDNLIPPPFIDYFAQFDFLRLDMFNDFILHVTNKQKILIK